VHEVKGGGHRNQHFKIIDWVAIGTMADPLVQRLALHPVHNQIKSFSLTRLSRGMGQGSQEPVAYRDDSGHLEGSQQLDLLGPAGMPFIDASEESRL
jgi:hypothetical protein